FRRARLAETPYAQPVATAQHARNRHDPLLLVRQKIAPRSLTLQGEHRLGDFFIGKAVQVEHSAPELDVGHGFDIEHERVHARAATMSAFMSRTAAVMPSN